MWGIIPAAGAGSRIQPLAFSKELLPVGSRIWMASGAASRCQRVPRRAHDSSRANQALLCDLAGKDGHSGVLRHRGFGASILRMSCSRSPGGLCDAVFRALPLVP